MATDPLLLLNAAECDEITSMTPVTDTLQRVLRDAKCLCVRQTLCFQNLE